MKRVWIVLLTLSVVLLAGRLWQEVTAGTTGRGGAASGNGDVNGDGARDITDAIYLLSWLFQGGPEPVALADSAELEDRVASLEGRLAALEGSQPTVSEVAEELFATHGAELTGPAGPAGPPGGQDPTAAAWWRLVRLLDPDGTSDALQGEAPRLLSCPPAREPALSLAIGEATMGNVIGFSGREAISSVYRYDIAFRTAQPDLKTANLVGSPARLALQRGELSSTIHGMVSEIGLASWDGKEAVYVVRMVPRLHRLLRGRNSRTWQQKTVPQIVEDVLAQWSLGAFELRLTDDYAPREFELQVGESDFDFISRLMEDEGIFYFFEQTEGGEKLILGDSNAALAATAGSPFAYHGHEAEPTVNGEEYIRTFQLLRGQFTGGSTLRDHDFTRPLLDLTASVTEAGGIGETYEYAPNLFDPARIQERARIQLERQSLERHRIRGTSTAREIQPGHVFALADGAGSGFGGKYLVTSVRHKGIVIQGDQKPCLYYGNMFSCIPDGVPFRPPRTTPRPRVNGPQTAMVVGPAGEETWPDEFGRIKVQFYWDREGSMDENSSSWIRVSQPLAGRNHGMLFLPEIGDEVLVAFEGGDPRRPYILGALYNGENPPPASLPESKDVQLIRSRTGHELVLDDRQGRENVTLRAAAGELELDSRNDLLMSSDSSLRASSGSDLNLQAGRAMGLNSGQAIELTAPITNVRGELRSDTSAGTATLSSQGIRFRDNAIVAWASVSSKGTMGSNEFGVTSVKHADVGVYAVSVDIDAASAGQLIPMAVATAAAPPSRPEDLRIVTVSQASSGQFLVYINSFSGPVDGSFVFLATAR